MGNVPLKPARPQSSTCAPSGALCQPHNRTCCRTCIAPIPPISSPARPAACSCLRLPCASASNKWIQTSGSACLLLPQATMRKCFKKVDSNKWIRLLAHASGYHAQVFQTSGFKQVDSNKWIRLLAPASGYYAQVLQTSGPGRVWRAGPQCPCPHCSPDSGHGRIGEGHAATRLPDSQLAGLLAWREGAGGPRLPGQSALL